MTRSNPGAVVFKISLDQTREAARVGKADADPFRRLEQAQHGFTTMRLREELTARCMSSHGFAYSKVTEAEYAQLEEATAEAANNNHAMSAVVEHSDQTPKTAAYMKALFGRGEEIDWDAVADGKVSQRELLDASGCDGWAAAAANLETLALFNGSYGRRLLGMVESEGLAPAFDVRQASDLPTVNRRIARLKQQLGIED